MPNPRILIAAGGTGGHVYPAIAIADALKAENPNTEILFVGTKNHMEWTAVPKAGYAIKNVWISGFQRRLTFKNLLFPVKLFTSLLQSFNIVSTFKPHVMVSCGGYVAGPVGWAAAKKSVDLVIQEQNSFPGVTNRMLAKFAKIIFTAFDEAKNYFTESNIQLVGNPSRSTLTKVSKADGLKAFNFTDDKRVLLAMGGSGGAKTINTTIFKNLEMLKQFQVIWQCGSRYYDELTTQFDTEKHPNIKLMPYIENMPEAYAAADVVMSRAGASSCAELLLTGKPSILVPSPNVAGDHQTKNAESMVEIGASILLKDNEASEKLNEILVPLFEDSKKIEKMSDSAIRNAKPDAAQKIAQEILILAKNRLN